MNTINKKLKYFSFFLIFSALIAARNSFGAVMDMGIETAPHNTGPILLNGMLHAWVSLIAAIAIFALALKYMVGGKLSRPIMLMGFGALTDSIIGLFFTSSSHLNYMWLGSLVFSVSVVLGIIWMANIFGVFQKQK